MHLDQVYLKFKNLLLKLNRKHLNKSIYLKLFFYLIINLYIYVLLMRANFFNLNLDLVVVNFMIQMILEQIHIFPLLTNYNIEILQYYYKNSN